MNRLHLLLLVSLLTGTGFILLQPTGGPEKRQILFPAGWPVPVYNFKKNLPTKEGFELGRALFYDPVLSRDSSISCSSCHLSFTGFAHTDHDLSHGIEGRIGKRNAPALVNLAWNPVFHWDGGVLHLEQQAINPMIHPDEMGNTLQEVLRRLNQSPTYRRKFFAAFGDSVIHTETLLKGLAQFTSSLISSGSRYDRYMAGDTAANFTEQEKSGLALFRQQCASCHPEPLFTSFAFENNGLPPDSLEPDSGRYLITRKKADAFRFKVPSLRNVAASFPYMHDGRFRNLRQVMEHYAANSVNSTTPGAKSLSETYLLGDKEKKDLIAFLLTLSDPAFLRKKEFQHPDFK
jgi:cytochrome c peroxidase